MSREYAEKRIAEALRLAKGNAAKARQQVIAWTYEDPKLLHALARPHLTGIVAHAVNRVISQKGKMPPEVPKAPKGLDMAPGSFGKEILGALSGRNAPNFGQESMAPPIKKKGASQQHIDAIRRLARKNSSQ